MPPVGSLALVLHSHMPYVEGFGTYPFGEEWLFDAVARSYLRVLPFARDMTFTVTPVLADQLEADGVADRMRSFVVEARAEACRLDVADVPAELRPACEHHAEVHERAVADLDALGGDVLAAFRAAESERGVALMASCATHAVLPMLATRACRRLQVEAGLAAHARRFATSGGFWLPECGYEPGLDRLLGERGVGWFCTDQSAREGPLDALVPVATPAGPVAFTIDWETVSRVWSMSGYPSDPLHADFHMKSMRGVRLWGIGGDPYDAAAADARAREQAHEFLDAVAAKLGRFAAERGRRGLLVFAADTELFGHWWHEGPVWLEEVVASAADRGVRLLDLPTALEEHPAEERPLARSTWGQGKDLSTWDSPEVADLAWGARRLELRVVGDVAARAVEGPAAERAVRELLAVQASDWAFLDKTAQAGDYAFQRATDHARAALEALDSREAPAARLRNLAPELSLAPLLEP